MKQLKELARLKFGLGRSYAEIAGSLGVARSSVQAALYWPYFFAKLINLKKL